MQTTATAAQALQNVALLTLQIQEREARIEWNGAELAGLYRRRHAEVLSALRQGATADEIGGITGLGN